jgi:hypothetical protein
MDLVYLCSYFRVIVMYVLIRFFSLRVINFAKDERNLEYR